MSTHPLAVKRRQDRRRHARILIALLVLGLLIAGLLALIQLRPNTSAGATGVAAEKSPELVFTAPNKQVSCQLTQDVARCVANEPKFAPPIECPAVLEVRVDSAAPVGTFICSEDQIKTAETLEYGDRVSRGDFTCHSYVSAMRCVNTANQHGFSLSRDAYIVF